MDSDLDDLIDAGDEEFVSVLIRVPRTRRLHTRRDFSYWNDAEFRSRFRMSKQSASIVLDQINPFIENKTSWYVFSCYTYVFKENRDVDIFLM